MNPFDEADRLLGSIAPTERPAQKALLRGAVAVAHHAMQAEVVAPTGTGKSYAALVAAAKAGHPVLISTATNNLQTQYRKDVAVVDKAMRRQGGSFDVQVLKGRRWYGCHLLADQLVNGAAQGSLLDLMSNPDNFDEDGEPIDHSAVKDAARWVLDPTNRTGDWADAPFTVSDDAVRQLTVDKDSCIQRDCPFYEACHYRRSRQRAKTAKVVLVNHALLAANVAAYGDLLPAHGTVIVDEAHKLEEYAIGAFSVEVTTRLRSDGQIAGTLVDLADLLLKLDPDAYTLAQRLRSISRDLRSLLDRVAGPRAGDHPLRGLRPDEIDRFEAIVNDLAERLLPAMEAFVLSVLDDSPVPLRKVMAQRAGSRIEGLLRLMQMLDSDEPGIALMVNVQGEGKRRRLTLRAAMVNVAALFDRFGWTSPEGDARGVLLMSATIPAGLSERLGLARVQRAAVPSPFDFATRCLVYVADDLPAATFKNREQWEPHALARARALADTALWAGGVLCLCSSFDQVKKFADTLRSLQYQHPGVTFIEDDGTQSKDEVMRKLTTAARPLFVGSRGYFEGVDLPRKLSCVIIPQICYPPPGDPLRDALHSLNPSDQFIHPFDVAEAATLLEQSAGRLIRCAQDRGMIAVLDRRVLWSEYADELKAALPKGAPIVGAAQNNYALQWLLSGAAPVAVA